jgi:hypothetical protein
MPHNSLAEEAGMSADSVTRLTCKVTPVVALLDQSAVPLCVMPDY